MSTTSVRQDAVLSSPRGARILAGRLPFIATILTSAALIFLVQPLFAKLATPLLGGTPSVWNVSLVCFQTALLAGYAYAHALARFVPLRHQVAVHGAVLVLAGLTLPIGLSGVLGAPNEGNPLVWLMGTFAVSIAPVFIAISATSPLLQHWYGHSGEKDAEDPYFLYGASNIGSLIGLVAYPVVLEPLIGVTTQGWIWAAGYAIASTGLIVCGLIVAARSRTAQTTEHHESATSTAPAGTMTERLRWLALAFLPSSLLVGTTSHISTDVASAPFLWSPPLILYIGSFIIAFGAREALFTRMAGIVLPVAAGLVLLTVFATSWPILIEIGIALAALGAAALYCHGTLAASRPPKSRLTEFYFIMSLGGVIGGAFNAILAPLLFSSVVEFPLIMALVLLTLPKGVSGGLIRVGIFTTIAMGSVVIGSMMSGHDKGDVQQFSAQLFLFVPLILLILARGSRSIALACVASLAAAAIAAPFMGKQTLLTERSFFGVHRVSQTEHLRVLIHGTTVHGAQRLEDQGRPTPITYYHATSPIGEVFSSYKERSPVGVVGLGVGSVACAMDPSQRGVFYEIDPVVVEIARNPALFNFLSACGGNSEIVMGDGRLTVADAQEGTYGFMLLDAFSSDAVPAHLLTREALSMFMSRTTDDGVLAIHISNRHLNLGPIIGRIAGAEGWVAIEKKSRVDNPLETFAAPTRVVALARHDTDLLPLLANGGWKPLTSDGKHPWTDERSNILGAWVANW
ncbi:fused MFS/spermidine synthase [Parvularcula marina]|uniref:Spermidine synthase n=1 Tax=Parvularcula marina TaxID=2292771 RepID=A0A371R869_9PROT|nr:fused MFS/spermidine synthase [Parvularcula marina]RFB01635.1 hypothetical protein DX908_15275 [Parvularcula marina]